jgi:hypothetical protein
LYFLGEAGVEVSQEAGEYVLRFSPGVGQVVTCVLQAEHSLAANDEARAKLDRAIATAELRAK